MIEGIRHARHRLRESFARLNARLLTNRRFTFTKSIYGPYLRDNPEDFTHRLCIEGYGSFIADTIAAYDQPFIFLDIGANAGVFSLVADRHPLCRRVYAFEPMPASYQNLKINIVRNQALKVTAVGAAISGSDHALATMSFNPKHTGTAKLARDHPGAIEVRNVNACSLARLIPDKGFSILAKIDVEGAEAEVIRVLRDAPFYPRLKSLIIEISSINAGEKGTRELLALLGNEGFAERSRSGADRHYDAWFERS